MNAGALPFPGLLASAPGLEVFGWSLVHFLWQGAVVALLLWLVLATLGSTRAHLRYLASCTALVLMTLCPMATLAWGWGQRPQLPGNVELAAASDRAAAEADTAPQAVLASGATTAAPQTTHARQVAADAPNPVPGVAARPQWTGYLRPILPWIVALWLAGVIALTLRLGVGWFRLQRLRRRDVRPVANQWQLVLARLADRLHVSRPVTLLESTLVEVPTLIGWLRPVILLSPAALVGLSAAQLEAILAHELAHVRRHDYLVNLVQTTLETLLFYHPAVWWVSSVIRAEREACCDDVAVRACGDRVEYAKALLSLESLRVTHAQLALAAGAGPLAARIRRIVGVPTARDNRSAWWMLAIIATGVLAMFALGNSSGAQAEGPRNESRTQAGQPADDWGPESNGLRCRLIAADSSMDDESPNMTGSTEQFSRGENVALAVELKNVGEKPVTLLGVRYGDSYPTAVGRLATASFAPHLFELEFSDAAGNPVPRPKREFVGSMLETSGASTHEIAHGESLVVLLRPAKFQAPMQHQLSPGLYRARVRYRGPSAEALAKIREVWPDKLQGKAWSGEVTSNEVAFSVAGDPAALKAADLAWGEVKDGLQAAVEFRGLRGKPPTSDPAGTFPVNSVLDVVFHVKNVSDKPISLVSETWRQGDGMTVKNAAGEEQHVGGAWYSGEPTMVRWTLAPGEVAEISAANLGVAVDQTALEKFEHPVGKTLIAVPGTYTVRFTIRMDSLQSRDDQGNLVFPGPGDWKGELVTGDAKLILRERTPQDDEQGGADRFVGRIEFVGTNGRRIESGTFTARVSSLRGEDLTREIRAGVNEIPDCTAVPVTVLVRASGYEEAVRFYVDFRPNQTTRIELSPAVPTRFRLVSAVDDSPVAGAKVRFFNKTSGKASAGPYPIQGIAGPVWATSRADGTVLLDTLQRTDPYYAELGDAVYYFYVEAPGMAGTFVGPVKAGHDLPDVVVGPHLEVRGEVRGTAEQLERFAAEWDQPFVMISDNPDATWFYAESKPLLTRQEGDKLTFHITGLRPGKLRIISNFGPHPHQVSHTFSRRDPKGTDEVLEIDVTRSIDDLLVGPAAKEVVNEGQPD